MDVFLSKKGLQESSSQSGLTCTYTDDAILTDEFGFNKFLFLIQDFNLNEIKQETQSFKKLAGQRFLLFFIHDLIRRQFLRSYFWVC